VLVLHLRVKQDNLDARQKEGKPPTDSQAAAEQVASSSDRRGRVDGALRPAAEMAGTAAELQSRVVPVVGAHIHSPT
jgi:hypothetical protein